ncbi:hypothetical protein CI238_12165 [Colletotrichum incanum]|uniref:Uncharacterized protein n=1 Tax=Colletotrichum incanum TaxID=1573173 RepID=A0A166SSF1_COLIC|nr:hypothetical protein CI238_12165 [Colletotrichum incanum]
MTAGQSYYFKVGGIPIRAAWVRRDFVSATKTSKYTAATSLTWFNESPDMLRAWFTYAGFGKHLCKRIICYGKSRNYIINNKSIKYVLRPNQLGAGRRNYIVQNRG